MASTHAPSEALLYAKEFIKNGRVDDADVAYQILDEVNKEICIARLGVGRLRRGRRKQLL